MQAWAGKLNGSSYVDETKAFNDLLGSQPFSNLTIGVLPSAVFPTADEMTKNTNPRLKVNLCFVEDFVFSASSRRLQAATGSRGKLEFNRNNAKQCLMQCVKPICS